MYKSNKIMFKKCLLHVYPEYLETLKTNVTGSSPSQNLISKLSKEKNRVGARTMCKQ